MYKKISVDFFRYWWNTGGTNTDDGFDKWFSENKDKYLQPCPPQLREVTDLREELLKFLQFANTMKRVYDLSQEELVVSQYIKSREQMKGGTK